MSLQDAQEREAIANTELALAQRQRLVRPWFKSVQGVITMIALVSSLAVNTFQFIDKSRELKEAKRELANVQEQQNDTQHRIDELKSQLLIQLAQTNHATREMQRQEILLRHMLETSALAASLKRDVADRIEFAKIADLAVLVLISDITHVSTDELKDGMDLRGDLHFNDESFRFLAMRMSAGGHWHSISVGDLRRLKTVGDVMDYSVDKLK